MLNAGVKPREVFGWAMYDFANSGYTTVVITAVFAAYFVGAVAGNADWGPLAWTCALSLSYAIVMLTMPALGAWADRHAAKKKLLMAVTVACVLCTAALACVGPGQVALAVVCIVLSNAFYSYGESLTAAFLAYVLWAQGQGQTAGQFVPITMLATALIYALAASVTFALMKEHALPQARRALGPSESQWQQMRKTFAQAKRYKDFMQLLVCAVAYQAGVAVAITLAAIYAEQVIGFKPEETMALIFVLNMAAFVGALVFGHAQDRIGHKLALSLTLLGWAITCAWAALSTSKEMFWWAAGLAGVCMGSSQSIGRAMAGLLVPPAQSAQYFGLWTFAIRLASIVGPLGYGLITWLTAGNQRVAIACTALLFLLGWLLLLPVNMIRGRHAALNDFSAQP
ncbi:MAG: MFS transporter [Betaproteobacteria bacterium]|nr:MFS transporter [Betaproteobacteria bacterium]